MRGSIQQRRKGSGSWSIILDLGYEMDAASGRRKRKQKWIGFKSDRRLSQKDQRQQAQQKLVELLGDVHAGRFAEPSKVTLVEWLRTWLATSAPLSGWRPATVRLYTNIIEKHLATSRIALTPVQRLRASDLERYLGALTAAPATIAVHHAVLHQALKRAVKDRLLTVSPAVDLEYRRATKDRTTQARRHCWSATEARRFVEAAATADAQVAAFMQVALDSGARKSELNGLAWEHVDLDAGTITIARQLDRAGVEPVFGVTKTDCQRTVELGAETLAALRVHKQNQAALKMRNRPVYVDFALVFAKEECDLQKPEAALGQPIDTLARTPFRRLIQQAGIKAIKFHGLRHTCATLLLAEGVPVHVVAARLGHSNPKMTLSVYAHVLPGMGAEAATTLARVLHR